MGPAQVRRINVLPKYVLPQKSKYFKIIQMYFRIVHIFFCLDLGFFEYKSYKNRLFKKSITIIQFTLYVIIVLTSDYGSEVLAFIILISHYFVQVLNLLLISNDKTLYSVFGALNEIDIALRIDLSFISEIKVIITNSLHIFFKIFIQTFICFTIKMCFVGIAVYNIITMFAFSVVIFYSFVFYLISCRLKKLTSILKKSNSGFSLLQTTYKAIVDLSEAQNNAFGPVFINSLFFNIYVVMSSVLYSVRFILSKNTAGGVVIIWYIIALESFFIILSPALCAGMLTTQAAIIKTILHDKLLEVNAGSETRDIERFIHYVKERNCQFYVYKLIPLNANLLGMLLSFCVTYLIVIIQFINK